MCLRSMVDIWRGYLVEFNIGINKRTGKEQAENVIVIETPPYKKKYR